MTNIDRKVKSLSWSKVYLWLNDRKNFIKTYFEGEPFFATKEVIFGSVLGAMIELQEFEDEDRIIQRVMSDLY